MIDTLNTTDSLLGWLREQAERKGIIDPQMLLGAATKLNALASDETDHLIELEHKVATLRAILLEQHGAAAKAKVHVEASPVYKQLRKQQEKCKQITEAIRLAKISARLKNEELRSGL